MAMQVAAGAADKVKAHVGAQPDASGFLLGTKSATETVVLSAATFKDDSATIAIANWAPEAEAIGRMLPCGIEIVGLYCGDNLRPKLESSLSALSKAIGSSSLAALMLSADKEDLSSSTFGSGTLSAPAAPSIIPADQDPLADKAMLRLTVQVPVLPGQATVAKSKVLSKAAAFCVMQNDTIVEILGTDNEADRSVADVVPVGPTVTETATSAGGGKKGGKKKATETEEPAKSSNEERSILQLKQMWSMNSEGEPEGPVMSYVPASKGAQVQKLVTLDVICYCSSDMDVQSALETMRKRGADQAQILADLTVSESEGSPSILHFTTDPHHPFPISLAVPAPKTEDYGPNESELLEFRKKKHAQFLLPMDRPFLRTAQALSLCIEKSVGTQRLKNVHVGLPPSGVKGGQVHCVQGSYEYCHYMQDKFDDDGWGCMYRSYQTVISWFRCQHYTSKPIPSHSEIQKMLVSMGDKPDRFVGSKQWIGAMEASILMDQYLDVTSKIINVPSGHDLEDKGRELAQHFDTQGTPINIGGGVLAFTILGVHYNNESGQIKFLVLDPHYTGGEDLPTIQNQSKKNACSGIPSVGWHDVTVFRKDSFYNLCLPQRPKAI